MDGKKLSRISLFSLAVILSAGIIIYLCLPKEPRYQGRTLSEWLKREQLEEGKYEGHDLPNEAAMRADCDAIQHIGINAAPWLLKWAAAKDSKTSKALTSWVNTRRFFHFHIRSAVELNEAAATGFLLTRVSSKPVWPIFVEWTNDRDPQRRRNGMAWLVYYKADKETLLPVLRRLISDADHEVQISAAFEFNVLFPQEAGKAGVYEKFPRFKAASTTTINTNHPTSDK